MCICCCTHSKCTQGLRPALIRVLDLFLLFAHFPFFYLTRIPSTISGIFQANALSVLSLSLTHTRNFLRAHRVRVAESSLVVSVWADRERDRNRVREKVFNIKHLRRRSLCWNDDMRSVCACLRAASGGVSGVLSLALSFSLSNICC